MATQSVETGSIVDGFLVCEKLHSGGMATLWRVTRPDFDTPIVMKVPALQISDDATIIVGFEMEMMILPRLSGIHVPRCYAVGDYSRQPFVVMEYIRGQSLLGRLDAAPLPPLEVAALGVKIATALVDLHRQDVIHLDIKPSNIMMRDSGEAALVDFGLSRHLLLPDLLEAEFQVPMGTGPYISPEQLLRNRADPRSDIFSLGVLLYHFATRVRPFGYPQSQRQLRRRLWRDPVPPRKLRPDIPPWLQEVILHCLEVDPEKRYPTAAQLAFDLQHPEEIRLTDRAERLQRDSYPIALRRWFHTIGVETLPHRPAPGWLAAAPIVMAAVDLSMGGEALGEELRAYIGRVLAALPNVRIACVSVLKLNRLTMNYTLDEEGRNIHVQRLVELKDWARPLGIAQERITFHVLEHADPAVALVEYAKLNHVDQIFIGARASTSIRRLLGSVSSQVVAEAPCTVTVVRVAPAGAEEKPTPSSEMVKVPEPS